MGIAGVVLAAAAAAQALAGPGFDVKTWRTDDGLPSDAVIALAQTPDGYLWIGTNAGLARFDGVAFTVFDRRTTPELSGEPCAPLVVDKVGALWIGTMGGGLARYENGRFEGWGRREGSTFEYALTILPVLGGGVWIGTNDRLHVFENGRFRVLGPEDGVTLSRPQPTHEAAGGVWVQGDLGRAGVFRNGSFREDPGVGVLYPRTVDRPARAYRGLDFTGWYSQYDPVSVTRWGLGGTQTYDLRVADQRDGVSRIVPVARDAAWVGLRQGGLRLVDGDRMTAIGAADGLPDGPVAAMLSDREGNLWVGTSGGLTRVSPKSFSSFSHSAIHVNDVAPAVIIESVLYDRVHTGGPSHATLPAGSKTLEFHYTATALAAPERTRFRYRLEPFEGDWVEAGSRRVAYYTSLPPGRYRFRVTAANESGVWNETGAVYDLRVEPHVYETVPFYVGVLGLVGLGVWGATRLRIRQIEARHQAVLAERSRIARELHDTVAQGFTGVSMQLEAVSARLGDAFGAREHLNRARTLVREGLADARRSVRALRPPLLESRDLGASLKAVAAGLTDGAGIAVSVSAWGPRLPSEAEDALFSVGQEAMTNAIRHGKCKTLRVDLRVENGAVTLTVEDDGEGFDSGSVSAGSGLTGMRERIVQLGGTLAIESGHPHGTRVVAKIRLP